MELDTNTGSSEQQHTEPSVTKSQIQEKYWRHFYKQRASLHIWFRYSLREENVWFSAAKADLNRTGHLTKIFQQILLGLFVCYFLIL